MAIHAEKRSQLRNLFMILFGAVLGAFILAFVVLYRYGPTGQYIAGNILLEPSLVSTLSYNDHNDKTGGSSRFVFDKLILIMPNSQRVTISQETYRKFYALIQSDLSIEDKKIQEVAQMFSRGNLANLSIQVRTNSPSSWQEETKVFESISFAPNSDYYNVQLHEEKSPNMWVYFYHPGIYKKAMEVLQP